MSEKRLLPAHFIKRGDPQCHFCCKKIEALKFGEEAVVYDNLDDYYRVYQFNRHGFEYIPCILSSAPKI